MQTMTDQEFYESVVPQMRDIVLGRETVNWAVPSGMMLCSKCESPAEQRRCCNFTPNHQDTRCGHLTFGEFCHIIG
jgi:hypothetical protein